MTSTWSQTIAPSNLAMDSTLMIAPRSPSTLTCLRLRRNLTSGVMTANLYLLLMPKGVKDMIIRVFTVSPVDIGRKASREVIMLAKRKQPPLLAYARAVPPTGPSVSLVPPPPMVF